MNDAELLQNYVREGSEAAFTELAARHLNRVYAAARRQVRSAQLAEDVSQLVFAELARKAGRIAPGTPLAAWLHVVTRRIAMNMQRSEIRRQARERAAVQMVEVASAPSIWSRLEPWLDAAVARLPEPERAAVLLRYFDNLSFSEVGAALGITDDAAQKRVSRALERMHGYFARRGIAATAAGIAADISANAAQSAPEALRLAIVSNPTAHAGAVIHATKLVAMTTHRKTLASAALAIATGTGLFEARVLMIQSGHLGSQRAQVIALESESASLETQRQALLARAGAARDANKFSDVAPNALATLDPATAAQMRSWLARVDQLREVFVDNPEAWIPELATLDERFWLDAAKSPNDLEPAQIRATLSLLRRNAVSGFGGYSALLAYAKANGGAAPTSMEDLVPYFTKPVDPAVLARYEIIPPAQRTEINPMSHEPVEYLMREKMPADIEYDFQLSFGLTQSSGSRALPRFANAAVRAYEAANGGAKPNDPAQLLPYLPQPVDPQKLAPFIK